MFARIIFTLLIAANRLYCRLIFRVGSPAVSPLPPSGPALLVSDHSSLTDPLVLFATAGRPIRFLMAQEFFTLPLLNRIFRLYDCIPINRGRLEIRPVRAMLHALAHGEVVGVFPEGGIDQYRKEEGHEGIGFVALKSGAPVVPVSVHWDKPRPPRLLRAMLTPTRATVRYGTPLAFGRDADYIRDRAREATDRILEAVRALRPLQ